MLGLLWTVYNVHKQFILNERITKYFGSREHFLIKNIQAALNWEIYKN